MLVVDTLRALSITAYMVMLAGLAHLLVDSRHRRHDRRRYPRWQALGPGVALLGLSAVGHNVARFGEPPTVFLPVNLVGFAFAAVALWRRV
jgi:hypothetical protein